MKPQIRNSVQQLLGEKYLYLLFLIWPVLSTLIVTFRARSRSFGAIIIAFSAIVGFTFYYKNVGSDSYTYSNIFQQWVNSSYLDLVEEFKQLYSKDSKIVDIVLSVIFFIVSRFTDDPRYFFLVIAILFSLFLLKLLRLFQAHIHKFSFTGLLSVSLFFLLVPLFYINHFRWYFALLIFLYGYLSFTIDARKSGIGLILFSIFIHFSFVAPIIGFICYRILGTKTIIYYILLAASFLISSDFLARTINEGSAVELSEYKRISAYTDESYREYIVDKASSKMFLLKYNDKITGYFLLGIIIMLAVSKTFKSVLEERLHCFSILLLAMANFGGDIQAFGTRFLIMFNLLAVVLVLFSVEKNTVSRIQTRIIQFALIVVIICNLLLKARFGLEYLSPEMLLPFFPLSLLIPMDSNILEFIK